MTVLLVVEVVLLYGLFRLLRGYYKYKTSPLNKIPGPKPYSYFQGHFISHMRVEPAFAPHKRWWKEASSSGNRDDVPMLHYHHTMGRSTVMILDKEIIKEILTAPYGKSETPRFGKVVELLKNIAGEYSMVTLEGTDWMRHRQILQPSFQTGILRDALTTAVPPRVKRLIKYWRTAEGREIDLTDHLSAFTLDVIGVVSFGHDFGGLDTVEKWSQKSSSTRSGVSNIRSEESSSTHTKDQSSNGDEKLGELEDPFIRSILQSFKLDIITTLCFIIGKPRWNSYLNPNTRRTNRLMNKEVDIIIENAQHGSSCSSSLGNETVNGKQGPTRSLLTLLLEANEKTQTAFSADGTSSSTTITRTKCLGQQEIR